MFSALIFLIEWLTYRSFMRKTNKMLMVAIIVNCTCHCFRVPLSVRPYLKHIGLRSTVASIIASLAAIQVRSSTCYLTVNLTRNFLSYKKISTFQIWLTDRLSSFLGLPLRLSPSTSPFCLETWLCKWPNRGLKQYPEWLVLCKLH